MSENNLSNQNSYTTKKIPPPELRGAGFQLGSCQEREVCLEGPAGTGKTVAALYKIHVLLSLYPGARALVARKSNTALSGSAMVTYRDNILRNRTDIGYFGGNRVKPPAYLYPNGSELIVNGLDKPQKIQSTEIDWAFVNEAVECDVEDIEFIRMRMRQRTGGPDVPYRQLILDCNPDAPTHWLNQRMNAGITKRLSSRHVDNPRFFSVNTNDWTEEGKEYVFGVLGGLSGVRYARYRLGLWAAAEGTVYEDSWDRVRNVVDRSPIPSSFPRYMAVDFGFTNPFVCLWAAIDPDNKLIIYRQLYKTRTLVEDHAIQIALSAQWFHLLPKNHPKYNPKPPPWADPLPRDIICDHDAEDRATLERHLGMHTTPAKKSVSDGIQAVASRMRPMGNGLPRLVVVRDSVIERDPELVRSKKPTCLEDEPESYIWDTRQGLKRGDQPVKADDHALDALRYIVAHLDLVPSGVSYAATPWR